MRIGLLADTHSDQSRLRRAVTQMRLYDVTTVLHAGDVEDAPTLRLLQGFDVWVARGNMDRATGLARVARDLFGPGRFRTLHKLSLGGRALVLVHNVDTAAVQDLIGSGDYDYVIHGHTHRRRDERVGDTRVINPGALSHPRGFHPPGFAILDLATGDLSWIVL